MRQSILSLIALLFAATVEAAVGEEWSSRMNSATQGRQWKSVTYGKNIFVAVSNSGDDSRVMTSVDGQNWKLSPSPDDSDWQSVTYGNGLFVAIAENETTDPKVMISTDGKTWTTQTAASQTRQWKYVAFGSDGAGGPLFVAVADDGSSATCAVMTSPDGKQWTCRNAAASSAWVSVIYANDLWVAVANDGYPNHQVMTSTNGINWDPQDSDVNAAWKNITYGEGLYVAVAFGGSNERVMTSPDGIEWTKRTSPISNWTSVRYGNGVFVAVSTSSGGAIMTSTNGITWETQDVPVSNTWIATAYGNGVFVAVSDEGGFGVSRAISSGFSIDPSFGLYTMSDQLPPDEEAPTVPQNVEATTVSHNTIEVDWSASTDNRGVTDYEVERCVGASCNSSFILAGTVSGAPPLTTYTDSGLTPSTTYGYRVRAKDAAGNASSYSSIDYATTSADPGIGFVQATTPTTPTGTTTLVRTFSSAPSAGNCIIVDIAAWTGTGAPTINSVADNHGNTYTLAIDELGPAAGIYAAMYYGPVVNTGGTFTVTVTFSGATDSTGMIREYTGVECSSPATNADSATGSGTLATGTVNPAGDALYVMGASFGPQAFTLTSSGWNERGKVDSNNTANIVTADAIGSGSKQATGTFGSTTTWAGLIATFDAD